MNDSVDFYKAQNDRMKLLLEFLGRPIHAHGGSDPDPDIVSAYNLAVESSLKAVRYMANHIVDDDCERALLETPELMAPAKSSEEQA